MTIADRVYAADELLAFLKRVGPLEAVWAMTTALEELQEQPASADHVRRAEQAFAESLAEANELTNVPVASGIKATRGKKAPAAATTAAEGDQP